MILTLDIGNTNIKTALFDGSDMKCYWRFPPIAPCHRTIRHIAGKSLSAQQYADGLRHGDHDVLRRAERELYH